MLTPKHLPLENVLLQARLAHVEDLFSLVARHLAGSDERQAARVREGLQRRHRWRSVNLGNGFALPHAAVHGQSTLRAVYVRSATPIVMGPEEAAPVHDGLVLIVPSPGLAAEYELLMGLTQALQQATLARALRQARRPATVQKLLLAQCGEVAARHAGVPAAAGAAA